MARDFFPGVDPIGKRLKMAKTDDAQHAWFTILGVARDVRSYALENKPRPQIYTTVEQNTDNEMTFIVRAEGVPLTSLERVVRVQMKALDPSLPLANFRTLEGLMARSIARPRFGTFLLGLFAVTALVLTGVGLYAVVAYATSQRTREIGIRMALGARGQHVLGLVLGQGMLPVLIGLGLGTAGSLALTRLLVNQLYEIKPTDPLTFLGVIGVLTLVTLAACILPARRAASIDPMEALREF
jgi:ABC-type antimicrobial peptide transport system permease subunit